MKLLYINWAVVEPWLNHVKSDFIKARLRSHSHVTKTRLCGKVGWCLYALPYALCVMKRH